MDELGVLIVGGIHHNTLGVIRAIGESGIPRENIFLVLIDERLRYSNFVQKSRYIKNKNYLIIKDTKDLISSLLRLSEDGMIRTIICCSDESVKEIIINHNKLAENFMMPSINIDINKCMAKDVQGVIAINSGLRIPISSVINEYRNTDWDIFPCIVKPITSVNGKKSDIKVITNKIELAEYLNKCTSFPVQVQQYIDKTMEFQLIGCSLNAGNGVIIPGFTEILRQPYNTNTGYLRYIPINRLDIDLEAVKIFLKNIGYTGLFSMEFIRDCNNVDYFLEINLRNDGNGYCVTSAGVNLPYIFVYYRANGILPLHERYQINKPIYFMPDFSDFKLGCREVGFICWFYQFISSQSHSVFNLKDIKPFIYCLYSYIMKLV